MGCLAIVGASGHGRVVADAAECSGEWDSLLFFDDGWPERQTNAGWEVRGDVAALLAAPQLCDAVVVAIGDGGVRMELMQRLADAGLTLASVIHPAAVVSRYATIEAGSVVFAGAVVNISARVGAGGIINTGATVDHDCVLAAGVHVSPGAHLAGGVSVGVQSWIGIGASVRQGLRIGSHVMVGAGATVVTDIEDGLTVAGTPARPLPDGNTVC